MARPPYIFTAGDNPQSVDLGYQAWGVSVRNLSAQWLSLGYNRWSAPTSQSTFFLDGEQIGTYQWAAPPGVVQPSAVVGQIAILAYTPTPLQDSSGAIGGLAASVASVTQVERFTNSTRPASSAANQGRLIMLTDYDRSVWKDTGTQFVSIEGEVFNVKQFNARGDGITDDTVNIQSALTAAGISGGIVYFPPGTYRVTSSLLIGQNCLVTGSWGALLQMSGAWTGSNGLFTFTLGGANMIVENLRIDGLRAGKAITSTARGVYIQNSSKVRVRRMHISDCSHAGILADGGSDITISDNYVFRGGDGVANGQYSNGISVDIGGAALSRVVITGNTCDSITDSGIGLHDNVTSVSCVGNTVLHTGIGHGIYFAGVQNCTVAGNVIKATGGVTGIFVNQNLNAYNVLDCAITGNIIIGPGGASANGITLQGTVANPVDRISVVGNTIRGWTNVGIYVAVECQFSTIVGNTITGNSSHGINLDSPTGNITYNNISFNTITGNTGMGINAHAAVTTNKIIGNMLQANVAGGTNLSASQKLTNGWAFNDQQDGQLSLTGQVLPQSDGAYDIGLAATGRMRNIFALGLRLSKDFQRSAQTPAFAATVTPDPTLGEIITINYTSSFTIANPVNAFTGQEIMFKLQHDATAGAYVITWGAQFKRAGGAFANTNTVNAVDLIAFQYDGAAGSWNEISRAVAVS